MTTVSIGTGAKRLFGFSVPVMMENVAVAATMEEVDRSPGASVNLDALRI